jgi:hypothetical protein
LFRFYPNKFQEEQGGILGYNKEKQRKEYYYIGIIDILMQYTTRKKAEHLLRAIVQEAVSLFFSLLFLFCL